MTPSSLWSGRGRNVAPPAWRGGRLAGGAGRPPAPPPSRPATFRRSGTEPTMRVEWTSYSSPIGALTVVECEAGPLVVEFPHRATTIKWAVRLRSAVPELHLGQG